MTREEQIEQATKDMVSPYKECFIDGVAWADEHPKNLWHDAQGNDLPDIDREVVVIDIRGKISYGHRPDHKGFHCKNIDTGEIEHLEPMTYDKGGWNIPDVKWWLDCVLPNLEEQQ